MKKTIKKGVTVITPKSKNSTKTEYHKGSMLGIFGEIKKLIAKNDELEREIFRTPGWQNEISLRQVRTQLPGNSD